MRIAYLSADHGIPVLGGKGGSVHVQQIVAGLAAAGHDVTLYCTRRGDGDGSRLGARIVEVARSDGARTTIEAAGSERLAKEYGWRGRADALAAMVLADHARTPFDFVYERYSLWSRAGVTVARRSGIPAIVEVNAPLVAEAEAYREISARAEALAIEREVLTGADAIIAVSDGVRDYAISKGAAAGAVNVVPNGVDIEAFNPAVAATAIAELGSGPAVGFVGGLKPWHGLQELLPAFEIVAARHPEARLLVVGDGPMRGWIEGFLAGTRLAGKAHITGWVDHGRLPSLVARMAIATAPYPELPGFYFSPLKLFEYMAAGRAVVASRLGQIAGVIDHDRTGLLSTPGDVRELADRLSTLIDDPDARLRLGAAAAQVARRHSWSSNAQRTIEIAAASIAARSLKVAL